MKNQVKELKDDQHRCNVYYLKTGGLHLEQNTKEKLNPNIKYKPWHMGKNKIC